MDVAKTSAENAPRKAWRAVVTSVTGYDGPKHLRTCPISKRVYCDGVPIMRIEGTDVTVLSARKTLDSDAEMAKVVDLVQKSIS